MSSLGNKFRELKQQIVEIKYKNIEELRTALSNCVTNNLSHTQDLEYNLLIHYSDDKAWRFYCEFIIDMNKYL